MRFFFVALSILMTVPLMAFSCNFKNPNFGSAVNQASSLYNVNSDAVKAYSNTDAQGQVVLSVNGRVACQYLPEDSTVSLTYIDEKLVNITISNPEDSDSLLKYAKEIFGKSDDENRKKNTDGKTAIAMWGEMPQYTVLYLGGDINGNGGAKSESLNITSKKHSDLFSKVAQEKENLLNKENQMNINSKGNNSNGDSRIDNPIPNSDSNSSSINKNGEYDPKALEKLKKEYEIQNESWKRSNN
jgi:hypothetical protein